MANSTISAGMNAETASWDVEPTLKRRFSVVCLLGYEYHSIYKYRINLYPILCFEKLNICALLQYLQKRPAGISMYLP